MTKTKTENKKNIFHLKFYIFFNLLSFRSVHKLNSVNYFNTKVFSKMNEQIHILGFFNFYLTNKMKLLHKEEFFKTQLEHKEFQFTHFKNS